MMYNISMKKIITSMLIIFTFVFTFSLVKDMVHAQAGAAPCTGQDCTGSNSLGLNFQLKNPLKVNTIQEAIKVIVNAIVRIAIPILVIFYIWSGLSFIFARGRPEEINKAKNMFFYTIIGTLLILGAWTIVNIVIGTVNSIIS